MVEEITLRKISNSEEIHMDMVTAPGYILKSVDWGTIKGTHNTYKYLNQVGVSVNNTFLGAREDITIEGWVVAQHERDMTEKKMVLNAFVNPQEPLEIFYGDYKIQFRPDNTIKYSINYAENNDVICKFQIVGTAHDPMFVDSLENRLSFATTTAGFHFPLVISPELPEGGVVFGSRTDSLIATVINKGSIPTGMRIVFKAKGSVSNPKLINVETQEQLLISKDLVAEEEIEINTSIGSKRVLGRIGETSAYSNYFVYKTLDSTWIQLAVGKNLFRYDADKGLDNLEVFVYFQNKFLEVQECH